MQAIINFQKIRSKLIVYAIKNLNTKCKQKSKKQKLITSSSFLYIGFLQS